MRRTNYFLMTALICMFFINESLMAQITNIVNYKFNNISAYPLSADNTANNVSASLSCTETFNTYSGTQSGSQAFYVNSVAGDAISMSNSSGTNTRYWTMMLSGSELSSYQSYQVYIQARRSSTGAQKLTLSYSSDNTSYSTFAYMNPGLDEFNEYRFDLTNITAIDLQDTLYFRFSASEATGTGTLRIDNLQLRAYNNSMERQAWITDWQLDGNIVGENDYFLGTKDTTDLIIKTDNTQRMIVDKNGVVGIGTTDTSEIGHGCVDACGRMKLDVRGDGRFTDPSGNNYVRVGYNSVNALIDNYGNGALLINYHSGKNTVIGGTSGTFLANNATSLAVNSGNVAIGAPTANDKLSVSHNQINGGIAINRLSQTSMKSQIKFQQNGADKWTLGVGPHEGLNNKFFIWNEDSAKLFFLINESGNVAIGTDTAIDKFTVAHNDINGGVAINRISQTSMKSQIKFQNNGVDKWNIGIDPDENKIDKMFIWNETKGEKFLTIDSDGNTAIGKDSAEAKLHVAGDLKIDSLPAMSGQLNMLVADSEGNIGVNPIPALCSTITCVNNTIGINTTGLPMATFQVENAVGNDPAIVVSKNDTVNITMNSNGQIFARDVFIYANDINFPDYVFENDYKQLSLGELDKYLKHNKHLPNMPSAKEIEKNGVINMNDINIKTVENVEVLYKYIIGLNEEVEKLREEVERMKKQSNQ